MLAGRAADDDRRSPLLERAEAELGHCGAVRLRDEAARELRRRGVKTGARRRRATGRRRARGPLRPRARGRRPGRARPHQQGDRGRAVPVGEDDREPHERACSPSSACAARGGRESRRARGVACRVACGRCAARDRSSRRTSGSPGRRCSASVAQHVLAMFGATAIVPVLIGFPVSHDAAVLAASARCCSSSSRATACRATRARPSRSSRRCSPRRPRAARRARSAGSWPRASRSR